LQKANIREFQSGSISYIFHILLHQHDFCYSLVNSQRLNTFSVRFVALLASDRLARTSKFLLISASYLLF